MTAAPGSASPPPQREQMNVVIVGHVDHGKSTLVGRLLADTGAIDPAKIAKVRAICEQQGKNFEYAFLLDALEAEQAQGITIDAARCFFKSALRDYIIIDAPGHIEFLKNMISGAARAEAAVLLIDAHEGVQENSRRHGYMLGLLGIRQIVVAVNKMDRIDYAQRAFQDIVAEYTAFLDRIGVHPAAFIPISALAGEGVVTTSATMPWHQGPSVLEAIDAFTKAPAPHERPLRLPLQDVYRFNRDGDDRRILAGRVAAGTVRIGDEVLLLPSGKRTRVASVEAFAIDPPPTEARAGESTGLTMTEQIFAQRGDIVCHPDHPPAVSNRLRTNLFWLGRRPLARGRTYKLKLATYAGPCEVEDILEVIDASALDQTGRRDRVERHEVAEIVLRLRRPLAVDLSHEFEETSRFVLVDEFDLAGGGIVRDVLPADEQDPAARWAHETGLVTRTLRESRRGHRALLVALHDDLEHGGAALASALEESQWSGGREVYRLALTAEDFLPPSGGELHPRSIAAGLLAGLINCGQVVLLTVPWVDAHPRDLALRVPGLDTVPCVQVRLAAGRDALEDPHDWTLDAQREPRALHDLVKSRLEALLR